MQIATTASSRMLRQPGVRALGAFSGPRGLARFRRFIETTDWEKRYLCHRGIDRVCFGVLIAAAFYFVPVLAPRLLG